jgi:transposase
MIGFPACVRVFLAVDPVDMRKHFDGLWAVAVNTLHINPREGAVLVFTNHRHTRVKLLFWDGTGVCVLAKRLEKGTFRWPQAGRPGASVGLAPEALAMLLSGIDLRDGRQRRWHGR